MKRLLIAVLRRLFAQRRPETFDPWSDTETCEAQQPDGLDPFDFASPASGGVRPPRRTRPAARLTLDDADTLGRFIPPGGGSNPIGGKPNNRITRRGGFLAAPTDQKFPST